MKIEYRHLRWLSFIWDAKLTTKAKVTAAALADHMNKNHDVAWPSNDRLKEMTSLSKDSVQRATKELEQAGWLAIERGGLNRGTSRYTPIFPPEVEEALAAHSNLTGRTERLAGRMERPRLAAESGLNQSNESANNNQRDFAKNGEKRKKPSPPNSEQKPASHKPFKDPPKQTKADKQAAQADLDKKAKVIADRQRVDLQRKQIAACRMPGNLVKLCNYYGWGDPPAGLDFADAKIWATKQATDQKKGNGGA